MSSRNKRTFFALVAALIVAAAVSVARRPVSGRLLDGSEVVLRKVSFGTNHTAPTAPLESLLCRLPAKWLETIRWKPSSGEQRDSGHSIFTFWLEFSKPPTKTQPLGYAIADENGFEATMTFAGPYGSYSPGGFSGNRVGFIRSSGTFVGNGFGSRNS
jgi:hypothetical protein